MSTTVGGAPATHGHSDSMNGRNPTMPAIPNSTAANGSPFPQDDHSRKPSMTVTAAGVTGFPANGGAVGGHQTKLSGLQFGSHPTGSSSALGTPPNLTHQSSNLSVSSLNPRSGSPANIASSPSPIPQPVSASGGKPPSSLQNYGSPVIFGQHPGDNTESNGMMRAQMPLGPQQDHARRGSAHSMHSDMGSMPPGPGRGGYAQANRGRNYPSQYQPQMPFSPGQSYRPPNPNGRGMPPNYQQHGRQPGFPNSPNLGTRSPAMMVANPGTPQMNQMHMVPGMQGQTGGYYNMGPQHVNRNPQSMRDRGKGGRGRRGHDNSRGCRGGTRGGRDRFERLHPDGFVPRNDPASEHYKSPPRPKSQPRAPPEPSVPSLPMSSYPIQDLSPESGNFEYFLTQTNQGFPVQADPSLSMMAQGNLQYHQWMNNQQHMPAQGYPYGMPPQSPRPPFQGPNASYMQPSYSSQGHPPPPSMSRQSSQMSVPDRPGSSIGQSVAQTPSIPSAAPSHTTSRAPSTSGPAKSFNIPAKRSSAIQIKNPNSGEVLDFSKPQPSPAPPATPTPTVVKSPTPPSRTSSAQDSIHTRSESVNVKTDEEKKREMQEAVKRKLAEEQAKNKQYPDTEEPMEKEEHLPAIEEDTTKSVEPTSTPTPDATPSEESDEPEEEPTAGEKDVPAATGGNSEKDDEMERMIAEMEAAEAEEARREESFNQKKAAEDAAKRQKEHEEEEAWQANLKEAEREAEAREEALSKKKADGLSDDETAQKMFAALKNADAATTSSNDSPIVQTPVESGTATPVSDVSMPPPARSTGTSRRSRPAELTLNTQPTEPPEPSATLKALKSAKMLQDPSSVDYPSGVASPNPALNANAPADRRFKYNKEFLLQFQSVFKEKPSLDWDQKLRDALGDGNESSTSARAAGSARTPSGMGGRNPSNRMPVPNSFQMGAFGQPPRAGPTQLPAGTTSEQRFAMSNAMGSQRGALAGNPFAAGRPMGMPLGGQMARTASSTGLSGMPASPRMGGPSRGGSRAESKRHKQSNKHTTEDNKHMPLTAGMDVGMLQTSSTGWKPRSLGQPLVTGPALGGDGHLAPDVVQRKVKAALNKMTPEKFDRISDQILEIAAQSKDENDGRTLRQVIQLTFEKATDEAHWASMYAMFCKRMLESMSADIRDEGIKDKNGNVVTGGNLFRKYLLNRCQEEFEQGWKVNLPPREEGESEAAAMLSDEYYIAAAAKRRGLGLVKFIGELFKLGMLTERIMHECIKKLLDYEGTPDEAEVESLTSLLRTVGVVLDQAESKAQPRMTVYFDRINSIIANPDLNSRLRFMLMDVVDLRRKGWHSKEDNKGPKTIEQIHAEAAAAAQHAEMQRLASQANRGGGRMPLGRGDARGFSGAYGQAPPPDANLVRSDDLRKLNMRARNTGATAGPSFGPSGLGQRTGSHRNRGPNAGTALLARGEDSATSSRTGTPPAQKENVKRDESSTNAFSALAGLESHEGPASPPSNHSSPPTQKSQPSIERERSPSPEKKE